MERWPAWADADLHLALGGVEHYAVDEEGQDAGSLGWEQLGPDGVEVEEGLRSSCW